MNLSDLRYLVAVADHRNFSRAAEACFVSQPNLSAQIKKLERELGVELLERRPGQVLLTAAGEQVVARARAVVADAESIYALARHAADPESGSLRLGIFPTLAAYLLPHVVPGLRARFPRLDLVLVEDKTAALVDQLDRGLLDAAILARPIDAAHLSETVLFDESFVLAVPRQHPLARTKGRVDLSMLAGEPVLLLDDGHCLRGQALSVCQLAGADERAGFRATSLETLRQMVAAGAGVTLLPKLAVSAPVPPNRNIVVIPFTDPVPSRSIAIYWRDTSAVGPLVTAVAEELRRAPLPL